MTRPQVTDDKGNWLENFLAYSSQTKLKKDRKKSAVRRPGFQLKCEFVASDHQM